MLKVILGQVIDKMF